MNVGKIRNFKDFYFTIFIKKKDTLLNIKCGSGSRIDQSEISNSRWSSKMKCEYVNIKYKEVLK